MILISTEVLGEIAITSKVLGQGHWPALIQCTGQIPQQSTAGPTITKVPDEQNVVEQLYRMWRESRTDVVASCTDVAGELYRT